MVMDMAMDMEVLACRFLRSDVFLNRQGIRVVDRQCFALFHSVPLTGRRRFMDVSPKQEEMMAKEAYKQVMRQVR